MHAQDQRHSGWLEGSGSINAPDLDPKSRDYLTRVSQMIRAKWSYPCLKDEATGKCEYKPAQLVIDFNITEDGRGGHVIVTRSSGMDVYDQRAVAAIRSAAPFPKIPAADGEGETEHRGRHDSR